MIALTHGRCTRRVEHEIVSRRRRPNCGLAIKVPRRVFEGSQGAPTSKKAVVGSAFAPVIDTAQRAHVMRAHVAEVRPACARARVPPRPLTLFLVGSKPRTVLILATDRRPPRGVRRAVQPYAAQRVQREGIRRAMAGRAASSSAERGALQTRKRGSTAAQSRPKLDFRYGS